MVQKHQNVQIKFLAMHITIQKFIHINKNIYIFMVGHLQNTFIEHDLNILMIFGIKEKYFWLIQCIVFVLQGHIWIFKYI